MDQSKDSTARSAPSVFHWGEPKRLFAEIFSASQDAAAIHDIIESLPYEIAVVDRHWNVLAANSSWLQSSAKCGANALLRGGNYRDYCESLSSQHPAETVALLEALDDLSEDRRDCFYHSQIAECDGTRHTFRVYISRMRMGGDVHASITREDISELVSLRDQCEMLNASMLGIEESERRRIGRELHDSTAQLLVALQLDVMRLKQMDQSPSTGEIFEDIADTIQKMHAEIRATSYVLHPPPHHQQPLHEALNALVSGFAQRTGLRISMHCDSTSHRHSGIVETILYRIAQEALVNVHRHARATEIEVCLTERPRHLHLMLHDNGVGIPEDDRRGRLSYASLGVGIPGMRERLAQLGGRLSIFPRKQGTCLVATLPTQRSGESGSVFQNLTLDHGCNAAIAKAD